MAKLQCLLAVQQQSPVFQNIFEQQFLELVLKETFVTLVESLQSSSIVEHVSDSCHHDLVLKDQACKVLGDTGSLKAKMTKCKTRTTFDFTLAVWSNMTDFEALVAKF